MQNWFKKQEPDKIWKRRQAMDAYTVVNLSSSVICYGIFRKAAATMSVGKYIPFHTSAIRQFLFIMLAMFYQD